MATQDSPKPTLTASLKTRLSHPFRSTRPEVKSTLSPDSLKATNDDELENLPSFRYKPLDSSKRSIRLLEILPGRDFEPIKGTLSSYDLDDTPQYIALSYMWNQGSQEKYIDCQGTKIRVGENLWHFLHQYRHKTSIQQYHERNPASSLRLWIDAVCINQEQNSERSHQVSLMRDIYTGAESVIVWLGLAQSNEELAFLLIRYPSLLRVEEMSAALVDLLNKSYWSRVWVVQEFVLAKTAEIWCGEFQADAANFETIWRDDRLLSGFAPLRQQIVNSRGWLLFMYRRDFRHSRKYRRELLGRRNSRTLKATFRLRDLLQAFSSSQSSEVYDKVYGFLGIASTGRGERIRPDYSKSSVDLLVDVLRNQCNEKTARGDEDDHNFIIFLMRMLNVSRMELARHVLQNSSEMQPFIYVLAVSDFMVASVSLLGTIVSVGSSVHQAEAFQESMWTAGGLSRSPMHPDDLSNSDIRDLGLLVTFPETRLALEFEDYHIPNALHRGRAEKLRQRLVAKSTETVVQSLIHRSSKGSLEDIYKEVHTPTQIDSKDLRRMILNSLGAGADVVSGAMREQSEWNTQPRYEQYTTFKGTNNIIGIICTSGSSDAPQLIPGDHICVFSDGNVSKNALIVRRNEIEGRWIIIGFAVIITSISSSEPRGVVQSLQQVFGRGVLHTRTDWDIIDSVVGEMLQENLCFHCHLTDLLELGRCGILNETQLDRLLVQSLRDDCNDEAHQCSLGNDQHGVLEFGL
ncbi:Nn.00g043660.m01.CDS01 [Neocucurbitaria sp. VM-36]